MGTREEFVSVLAAARGDIPADLLLSNAQVVNLYRGNPADLEALEVTFANPAMNAFLQDRLTLALSTHQVGVAGDLFGIRSGLLTYHLPWKLRGVGVGLQSLQAGMYSQNDFRLSYGWKLAEYLAVGANVDFFERSFDRSKFYLFDENDPVFENGTSKWNQSFGVGFSMLPTQWMNFSMSVEHLNEPDISFGSGIIRQPISFSTGFKFYLGNVNLVSSLTSLNSSDVTAVGASKVGDQLSDRMLYGAELPIENLGLFRFSFGHRAMQFEAETYLYKNWYFNYRYEYPLTEINLASSGTHRFGFLLDLHRLPKLPEPQPLPRIPGVHAAPVRLRPAAKPQGAVFIVADRELVEVQRRRVSRRVDETIDQNRLVTLFPEDLGDIKGLREDSFTKLDLLKMDVSDPTVRPQGIYSPNYYGVLEGIGFRLQNTSIPAELFAYSGAERRANALLNVITGGRTAVRKNVPVYVPGQSPLTLVNVSDLLKLNEEYQTVTKPEATTFHIFPAYQENYFAPWRLEIRNSQNEIVFMTEGEGELPAKLNWDWTLRDGQLAPPGHYYYTFAYQNNDREIVYTSRGTLRIIHHNRAYAIDITPNAPLTKMDADRYILILGGDKSLTPQQLPEMGNVGNK